MYVLPHPLSSKRAPLTHVTAGKRPIRNQPQSLTITTQTTVAEAQKLLAKAARVSDPHRLAIVDPETKKIIKDRAYLLAQVPGVESTGSIAVKDLGAQIGWRTVYMIEYAGPLFLSLLLANQTVRSHVYPTALFGEFSTPDGKPAPLSGIQLLLLVMMQVHFIKRELETVFLHKFSAATMPFVYVFRNSAHYWLLAGFNIPYFAFAPTAVANAPLDVLPEWHSYAVYAGIALYVFGELANFNAHRVLANLRPAGTTKRGIPKGFGFGFVTCPNYFFEIVAWIGVTLVVRSWASVLFVAVAWVTMQGWAVAREKRYRAEFPEYKPKKWALTPFVNVPVRKPRKE
jgi:very-long-chain enoyl-CoA reductase